MNNKIDLIKEKEKLALAKLNQHKDVSNKTNLNKDKSNWLFSSYKLCFTAKTFSQYKLLLPTAFIRLECNGTIHGPFRALLDSGAQPNLISHTLSKQLKMPLMQSSKRLIGVASQPCTISKKVDILIRPWFDSDVCVNDQMWVLPNEDTWKPLLPSQELSVQRKDEQFRQTLADPIYYLPRQVHIILGIRFVAAIFDSKIGYEAEGTAVISTPFGNVIMGKCNEESTDKNLECNVSIIDNDVGERLNKMLEKLWEMDRVGNDSHRTQEQEMVEQHFMETHRRDETGRFTVQIPFKPGMHNIGSSRQVALRRFLHTEKKMESDSELREFYVSQMREEIRNGHMKPVTREPIPGRMCYYIPHHCVPKDKKPRIVYDASCKTNRGISLNDAQLLGEKLQPDLHQTTMRLRRYKFVVCGDIKKMFNQINVDEKQWDCQRIFWRENPNELLREYWLTVVTFGLTSSAHLSVRCVLQAAREAEKEFPEAAKIIQRDFYMDDCVTGADTVEKAINIANEIDKVLSGACFKLCKWKSNSNEVLNALNSNEPEEQSMVFAEDGQTSILGLKWLFTRDQYTFVVKTPLILAPITKRKIVSCVSQLFDPNGYAGPVIVSGKLLIQELWKAKIDWDEAVDERLEKAWTRFWSEIKHLENFRIDRWIGTANGTQCKLIGFSDSSQSAYGAVVYVRTVYPDGTIKCNLIMSKSRVAPLKTITIPRLELSAAELLSRVIVDVKKSMEFENAEYILWIDSSPALYWLRKAPDSLKTFIANRVASIQRNSDLQCWRYVNTKDNPADLLSRGVKPSDLINNQLWLHGPEWLSRPESDWPAEQFPMKMPDGIDPELRVHTVTEIKNRYVDIGTKKWNAEEKKFEKVPILDYAVDLDKAVNLIGFGIRFLNALRTKYKPPKVDTRSKKKKAHPPTDKEKALAMEYFIRKAQEEYFSLELAALKKGKGISEKSKLIALNPRLDSNGIMRVGGRLDKAAIDYEMRHPVIIPKNSRLAWLLMDHAHRKNHHGGVQVVMHYLRQKYWIPQLRDELKQFARKCVQCVRTKPLTEDQLMADLPADRVRPGKCFEVSGVDYAGPFNVKYVDRDGNQIVMVKAWVVLFVCLKTRAIHMEIVDDLTSSSFIACYECFVGRRGPCYKMYSDNGTSFIGAEREIARAFKEWQEDGTVDSIAKRGTQWIFMTPGAPHQGGIYEAAVKSMKYHLKRIVGARIMENRQFRTLLCQIEAILNSRPLTPLSDDPDDRQALTPGHFFADGPLVVPPPFQYMNESNLEGKKLWIERQKMLAHFWQRWQVEYLTTLQERKKWRREKENVKVGLLVLIRNENLPPAQWRLGRIVELLPGKDGLVRNVIVKTEKGAFKRPVQKICILPVDSAEK